MQKLSSGSNESSILAIFVNIFVAVFVAKIIKKNMKIELSFERELDFYNLGGLENEPPRAL